MEIELSKIAGNFPGAETLGIFFTFDLIHASSYKRF